MDMTRPTAPRASGGEVASTDVRREQTRAYDPDETGYVEVDGVRVFWERYGDGEQTILLLPTWQIVHSGLWKAQIPYLARHFRVVTFDPRGNGRSDRPDEPAAYDQSAYARDAVAVLDAAGVERAVVLSLSLGAQRALLLAAQHPERVEGAVFVAPGRSARPGTARAPRVLVRGDERDRRGVGQGEPPLLAARLARLSRVLLRRRCSTSPTRPSRSRTAVGWGLETDAETILARRGCA